MFKNPTHYDFKSILSENIKLRKELFELLTEDMHEEITSLHDKFVDSSVMMKRSILRSMKLKNMKMQFILEFYEDFAEDVEKIKIKVKRA